MHVLHRIQKTKTPERPQDGRSPVEPMRITLKRGLFALIDADLYAELSKFHWKAVKSAQCWYAVRRSTKNGITTTIRMHRQVAETPADMDCHHVDNNSLNNTRRNLLNVFKETHYLLHRYHHYQVGIKKTNP